MCAVTQSTSSSPSPTKVFDGLLEILQCLKCLLSLPEAAQQILGNHRVNIIPMDSLGRRKPVCGTQ